MTLEKDLSTSIRDNFATFKLAESKYAAAVQKVNKEHQQRGISHAADIAIRHKEIIQKLSWPIVRQVDDIVELFENSVAKSRLDSIALVYHTQDTANFRHEGELEDCQHAALATAHVFETEVKNAARLAHNYKRLIAILSCYDKASSPIVESQLAAKLTARLAYAAERAVGQVEELRRVAQLTPATADGASKHIAEIAQDLKNTAINVEKRVNDNVDSFPGQAVEEKAPESHSSSKTDDIMDVIIDRAGKVLHENEPSTDAFYLADLVIRLHQRLSNGSEFPRNWMARPPETNIHPEQLLADILGAVENLSQNPHLCTKEQELARLVDSMDEHIRNGGRLPGIWARGQRPDHTRMQAFIRTGDEDIKKTLDNIDVRANKSRNRHVGEKLNDPTPKAEPAQRPPPNLKMLNTNNLVWWMREISNRPLQSLLDQVNKADDLPMITQEIDRRCKDGNDLPDDWMPAPPLEKSFSQEQLESDTNALHSYLIVLTRKVALSPGSCIHHALELANYFRLFDQRIKEGVELPACWKPNPPTDNVMLAPVDGVLQEQLRLAGNILKRATDNTELAEDVVLAGRVIELSRWIVAGGDLPTPWAMGQRPPQKKKD